jgi:hypothetical protein
MSSRQAHQEVLLLKNTSHAPRANFHLQGIWRDAEQGKMTYVTPQRGKETNLEHVQIYRTIVNLYKPMG